MWGGGSALDIGCNEGGLSKRFPGIDYHGIDIDKDAVSTARKKGLNVVQHNLDTQLPYTANSFDVVFCLDVLEHLSNPKSVMMEIKRVVKKNGKIVISLPNDYALSNVFRMLSGRPIISRKLVWDEHTHLHFPTLDESIRFASEYFRIKKISYVEDGLIAEYFSGTIARLLNAISRRLFARTIIFVLENSNA